MTTKIKVGLFFGGQSAEHEVSLQSARNIYAALNQNKYQPFLFAISKTGQWYLAPATNFLLHPHDPKNISLNLEAYQPITFIPQSNGQFINLHTHEIQTVDLAFPILHGPFGEDGSIQGLFKIINLPFVGADILGSAIGMDKDIMKRLLQAANLPVAKFLTFTQNNTLSYEQVVTELNNPFFIKPANLGSSIGINKVNSQSQYDQALTEAFTHDDKIILETYIAGREIECSVLGNQPPKASLPGEIIPHHEFYSYEAKYLDEQGATLKIPANLNPNLTQKIQTLALKTFEVLSCRDFARVDFFLQADNQIFINEINTIPGFTSISMYPQLWEKSGLNYQDLIDQLLQFAWNRR